MYRTDDTIVALATAVEQSLRAVVRFSGPDAHRIVRSLVQCTTWPRRFPAAVVGRLRLPSGALEVDVWLWAEGGSYTAEPLAELHLPGSLPVVRWVIEQSLARGARLAERGEFTLRAFLHGRVDLTEAEAVLALVNAASDEAFRVALEQLDGGLHRPLQSIRTRLLDALAELEAALDFAEEDIEFITREALEAAIADAQDALRTILQQMHLREQLPTQRTIVLCGPPNAGKSSLFNRLVRHDAAIVAPVAGTTRDYLVAELKLAGLRARLIDTPGVETEPRAAAEQQGQQHARRLRQSASLELWCIPADQPLERGPELTAVPSRWVLLTKADLIEPSKRAAELARLVRQYPAQRHLAVSAIGPPGIEPLWQALEQWAAADDSKPGYLVVPETAARCRRCVEAALEQLQAAHAAVRQGQSEELIATLLRAALEEIGVVTGEVHTEEILDRIFQQFCIGK